MEDVHLQSAAQAVERLRAAYRAMGDNLAQVVVGQEEVLRLLTTGLICGGHMLLIGVPGLAKTLTVKTLANCLGWSFSRIQFTPDLMPADITGTEILQGGAASGDRQLVFRSGPIFANLILADEINRTPPKTQAALLEAMQEHAVTVAGETHHLPEPFVVVATQNPIEQEGTYPLPEAQLDRFLLMIKVEYPTRAQELDIASRPGRMAIPPMAQVATPEEFLAFRDLIDQVPVADHVLAFAVDLCTATRPQAASADDYIKRYVQWGVGPRACQHLVTAAKAGAILDGRPGPEIRDVAAMALPVLRHRLCLNYNALGEGLDVEDVIRHLLDAAKNPV